MDIRKLIDRYLGIPLLFFLKVLCLASHRPKRAVPTRRDVRKILLIYLSGIGDTVMVLTCLEHIRSRYPKAHIAFLASSQNYGIVKTNPYTSRVYHLVTTRGAYAFAQSLLAILKQLRTTRYDVILDFEQFLRLSAIICLLSDAKQRFGFATHNQYRHCAYTKATDFNASVHTLANFYGLLTLLGISRAPDKLDKVFVSEQDKQAVQRILDERGITNGSFVIGIHPGSGRTAMSRRWEPGKFSAIADLLVEHYRANVVFTGTTSEKPLIETILAETKYARRCPNLAGRLTLSQLPFLIKQCRAVVTNDTGPLHIAAAMDVPVVALFGPNTPMRYGPVGNGHHVIYKGLDCSPCIIAHEGIVPHCNNNRCMQEISVDEVWRALEFVLSKGNNNRRL